MQCARLDVILNSKYLVKECVQVASPQVQVDHLVRMCLI